MAASSISGSIQKFPIYSSQYLFKVFTLTVSELIKRELNQISNPETDKMREDRFFVLLSGLEKQVAPALGSSLDQIRSHCRTVVNQLYTYTKETPIPEKNVSLAQRQNPEHHNTVIAILVSEIFRREYVFANGSELSDETARIHEDRFLKMRNATSDKLALPKKTFNPDELRIYSQLVSEILSLQADFPIPTTCVSSSSNTSSSTSSTEPSNPVAQVARMVTTITSSSITTSSNGT